MNQEMNSPKYLGFFVGCEMTTFLDTFEDPFEKQNGDQQTLNLIH